MQKNGADISRWYKRDVARRRWISGRCNLSQRATIRLESGVRNHRAREAPLSHPRLHTHPPHPSVSSSSTWEPLIKVHFVRRWPPGSRYVSHRPALIYLRFLFVDSSAVLRDDMHHVVVVGNSVDLARPCASSGSTFLE